MGSPKRWGPWATSLLAILIAGTWLATASFQVVDKSQIIGNDSMQLVSSGHEVVQIITATSDSISRVDLTLRKPHAGKEGALRLQIVEVTGGQIDGPLKLGEVLREASMDTGSASNTFRHSFEFESVAVTPGSAYAIRLTSDDSEDAAVSPAGWPVNNYNGGGLFVDGKPTYGDLYFAFFHSGGVGEILDKMKPWRPFPLNKSAFVVAMFLTAAGTFGWLLWMVIAGLPVVGKQNTSDGDAEPSSSSAPSRTAGSSASVTPRPSGTATP